MQTHSNEIAHPEKPSAIATNKLIFYVTIIFVVILTYFPVISTNYGYVDDYSFIKYAIDGSNKILSQSFSGDRFLSGLLTNFLFHAFNSINSIKYIRATSVIFISLFSVMIFYFLTSVGYDKKSSAAYSILVACTPSFQIYGSWAVLVGAPLSAIFALLAAFYYIRLKGTFLFLTRAVLMFISLLFYQPSAMIFFSLIPIILYSKLGRNENKSEIFKSMILYVLSGFSGILAAYLALKFYHLLGFHVSHRSSITNNIISKTEWFFRGPLISSTNIFMVRPQFLTSIIILILFLLLLAVQKKTRNVLFILSLSCAIPLSYIPNLVVAGDWASNRTLVGLEVVWCGFVLLFLDWLFKSINNLSSKIFVGLALFAIILNSQKNILDEFVIPGSLDYAYALHEMRVLNPKDGETVCIIPSDWTATLARYASMDDFGRTPFSATWSATSIFYDSLHLLHPKRKVKFVISENKKCQYAIKTPESETYRTFIGKLYTLGTNR